MKMKYYTFHVESESGSQFEAYYQDESGKVEQIISTGDYGDMIDALLDHAGVDVSFTHALDYKDIEDDEGRLASRNDLLKKSQK